MRPYSFQDLTIVVGALSILGRNSGEITFPNERYTFQFDESGGVTSSENANWRWAEVTLRLSYGALSNQELQVLLNLGATTSFTLIDNNGTTLYEIPTARIVKQPDASFETERGEREWQLAGFCIANEGTNI